MASPPALVNPQSPLTSLNSRNVAGEMRDLRTLVIIEALKRRFTNTLTNAPLKFHRLPRRFPDGAEPCCGNLWNDKDCGDFFARNG